jgi:hypothetical protein
MQTNSLLKKGFAVGIILLCLVTSSIPFTCDCTVSSGIQKDDVRDSPPNEEWNRTYSNPLGSYGKCVQVSPDGGYIVTGDAGYGYWYDVYLLKVDSQGNELWHRTFGNQSVARYDGGNWVEVTRDNGYIVTGDNCRIYSIEGTTLPSDTGNSNTATTITGASFSRLDQYTVGMNTKPLAKGRGDQQFYAFDNSVYPVQSVWFDPTDPGTLHVIGESYADSYIFAGTWADGVWYVCAYYGGLYTVDPTTGDMTLIGGSTQLNGLGYVDTTGIMYGCHGTNLYSVDMTSGATTLVGPMNNAGIMIDMAVNWNGDAYGIDSVDNNLYSIDLSTGTATVIGSTDISCAYAGMAFDKENNVLYLSAYTYTGQGKLYTVDVTTGHATLIGLFQNGDEIEGLAIPYDGVWYHYDNRVWLIKTDANGNEEWNKTYAFNQGLGHASGSCVKQTKDGGYIITGSDAGRLLLIKTDGAGNELWNKTYYGSYTTGTSLALTTDSGYIMTGGNHYRLLLMKTDENGTVQWEREYFNDSWPGSHGNSIQQTPDGGYIIGGDTSPHLPHNWATDLFLMKTDENGNEVWNRSFGGSGWEWGGTAIQTADGDYVVGGTQIGLQGVVPDKFWFIQTHPDGSIVWDHCYMPTLSARCSRVQQTPDHGFIATGGADVASGPSCVILKISRMNQPPMPPTIAGPASGKVGHLCNFTFNSTDPDTDDIYYYVDWGDSSSGWVGPFASGAEVTLQHAWNRTDQYTIFAQAKDSNDDESTWSKPFTVSIVQHAFLIGSIHNVYPWDDYYITFAPTRVLAIWFAPFSVARYSFGSMMVSKDSAGFVGKSFVFGMFDAAVVANMTTSMPEYLG